MWALPQATAAEVVAFTRNISSQYPEAFSSYKHTLWLLVEKCCREKFKQNVMTILHISFSTVNASAIQLQEVRERRHLFGWPRELIKHQLQHGAYFSNSASGGREAPSVSLVKGVNQTVHDIAGHQTVVLVIE
jgi:hypothetical protein